MEDFSNYGCEPIVRNFAAIQTENLNIKKINSILVGILLIVGICGVVAFLNTRNSKEEKTNL